MFWSFIQLHLNRLGQHSLRVTAVIMISIVMSLRSYLFLRWDGTVRTRVICSMEISVEDIGSWSRQAHTNLIAKQATPQEQLTQLISLTVIYSHYIRHDPCSFWSCIKLDGASFVFCACGDTKAINEWIADQGTCKNYSNAQPSLQ